MSTPGVRPKRRTRLEYERLVDLAVFRPGDHNLADRLLEVYREPAPEPAAPHGWQYTQAQRLGPGATVSPLAALRARIPVGDLLP